MALWRDPLDDLIEDLERAVPTEPPMAPWPTLSERDAHLVDLQIAVSTLIYSHTDADLEAYQHYQDACRRLQAFDAKYGTVWGFPVVDQSTRRL
jgi:hypothetical protein